MDKHLSRLNKRLYEPGRERMEKGLRRLPLQCTCPICGKEWEQDKLSKRQTCSDECKIELIRRRNTLPAEMKRPPPPDGYYKYRATPVECTCEVCGKKWMETRLGRLSRACSKECKSELMSQANIKRYQTGLTKDGKPFKRKKKKEKPQRGTTYFLRSPKGETYSFQNLAEFVADHQVELLWKRYEDTHIRHTVQQVQEGLVRLAPWAARRLESWNGWTWNANAEAAQTNVEQTPYQQL
jgi:predicted nucleic acid-binding Zn ribbon protein